MEISEEQSNVDEREIDVSAAPTVKEVIQAIKATKQPPPESEEDIRTRSLVVASFWFVVICLGLPIWWWTTSIHRASLPLQDMLAWADGKVSISEPTGHSSIVADKRVMNRRASLLFLST